MQQKITFSKVSNMKNVPFDRLVKWLTKYKMHLCLIPTWFRWEIENPLIVTKMCHSVTIFLANVTVKKWFKIWIFSEVKFFEILVPWNGNQSPIALIWPQNDLLRWILRWIFDHVAVQKMFLVQIFYILIQNNDKYKTF